MDSEMAPSIIERKYGNGATGNTIAAVFSMAWYKAVHVC